MGPGDRQLQLTGSRCALASTPRLLVTLATLLLVSLPSSQGICELPSHWKGGWFQNGARDVISITRTEFSSKGVCWQSKDGQKFLFKKNDCFRCLAISEKHANVLMYKETYCQPISDLDHLCSSINGDAPLYSMFRRDAPAAPCPFKGPLTFSYNVGSGLCTTPASNIDSCTRDSRLLLRYQACPDMKGTESQEVKLECIGEWKEGTTKYFVGRIDSRKALTDEDKYRCFAWEHSREKDLYDYKMAQSEDATCNGVPSASDGAVILQIKKAGSYSGCRLPTWVTHHRRWHALDRGAIYVVAHSNATLRLHHVHSSSAAVISSTAKDNVIDMGAASGQQDGRFKAGYSGKAQANGAGKRKYWSRDHGRSDGEFDEPGVATEARIVCSQRLRESPNHVMLVTHYTKGCSSGYVCTVLYRRGQHIIEMQQGSPSILPEQACLASNFNASAAPYITLISGSPAPQPCPLAGVWAAQEAGEGLSDGGCQERRVTHLRAGCGGVQHNMEFVQSCDPPEAGLHSYVCHGHWQEGRSVFVVASPSDRPAHRLCLTASVDSEEDSHRNNFRDQNSFYNNRDDHNRDFGNPYDRESEEDLSFNYDSNSFNNNDGFRVEDYERAASPKAEEYAPRSDQLGSGSHVNSHHVGDDKEYNSHRYGPVTRGNRQMLDGINLLLSNRTLVITAHAHSCPRRVVPPTTFLSVNLTIKTECLVASSGRRAKLELLMIPNLLLTATAEPQVALL
ncbi:uncharacterized protein LOC108669039 [Hyalella azteca]|uniref:Uncharacterized protein LOC108669039 n=1 Tax=Hyalella azteca TaxID=294128 RepID=A0A8B7NDX6_HYAAZ|nr:uncharacterized protein LOC108669039 [Hyalella azteca]